MTDWQLVFLGAMAVSLVIMAAIQVGLIIAVLRLAKQGMAAVEDVRREMKPLIAKANTIADDASRASALAVAQVERIDRFMATTTTRVEEGLGLLQTVIAGPASKAAGIIAAVRAAMQAFQYFRDRRRSHGDDGQVREDEDAMFVG